MMLQNLEKVFFNSFMVHSVLHEQLFCIQYDYIDICKGSCLSSTSSLL